MLGPSDSSSYCWTGSGSDFLGLLPPLGAGGPLVKKRKLDAAEADDQTDLLLADYPTAANTAVSTFDTDFAYFENAMDPLGVEDPWLRGGGPSGWGGSEHLLQDPNSSDTGGGALLATPRVLKQEDDDVPAELLLQQIPASSVPSVKSAISRTNSYRGNNTSATSSSSSSGGDGQHRPELTETILRELNDITEFERDESLRKHLVAYEDGISFPLGEGGRELLRACLNVCGCKGRQLQGASVPTLLKLAQEWNLWNVAIRIKVERSQGKFCPAHESFVKFKATQSAQRKFVKKEHMVTQRDPNGRISQIVYDEQRKITLGKEGREALRAQLRRLHERSAAQMDELLERHGFKYSELRNATVSQLTRMAYICDIWNEVVHFARQQEEKKDKPTNKKRTRRRSAIDDDDDDDDDDDEDDQTTNEEADDRVVVPPPDQHEELLLRMPSSSAYDQPSYDPADYLLGTLPVDYSSYGQWGSA